MNKKTEFLLSVVLSVLLLVCLIPMPYGYYTFVRFVAMCVFAWMAYEGYQRKENNEWMVFLALAVLFQPLLLIKLGRVLWMIVDVVVAAYMIFRQIKGNKSEMDNFLRRFKSFVPVVFMCAALCGCVDANHQSEFYRIQRNDIAGYEAFINKYPQSIYVKDARERIETAREEIQRGTRGERSGNAEAGVGIWK